jgi:hypothetical protein
MVSRLPAPALGKTAAGTGFEALLAGSHLLPVTSQRYNAYQRVLELLDSTATARLSEAERELVRDIAEGMLLSRATTLEAIEEEWDDAAVALTFLTARRRVSRHTASELWDRICEAGPQCPETQAPSALTLAQ